MPYMKEVYKAGKTIEVRKYYTYWYHRKCDRSIRMSKTTEKAKRGNERARERELRRTINASFQEGDTHLVLDYNTMCKPEGRSEMKENIQDFLKEMRTYYKKLGIPFKYIHVPEIGKRGARHHHLIINTPEQVSQRMITKLWKGRGRTHFNPLDETGDYSKLSSYLLKQASRNIGTEKELQGKCWTCSHNLSKGERLFYKPIRDKGWYNRVAKVPKKIADTYYLQQDSVEEGIIEKTGYSYFAYRLIQINQTWKESELEWDKI